MLKQVSGSEFTLKPRFWGAARWLIWATVAFVLLRGIVSMLPGAKTAASPAPAAVAATPITDENVPSFAALFTREYLTFQPGEAQTRTARLDPFLAPGIDRTGGLDYSHTTRAQSITQVWPWHTTARGPGQWIATVVAQIQDGSDGKTMPPPRYLALAVPVSAWKGGLAVSAYPVFVPVPLDKPGLDAAQQDPGDLVSDPDPAVRDLLLGFLKAYTTGTPAELRYYLLPGVALTGLNGQLALQDLAAFQLRKDGDRYWAVAEAVMRDPVTGADYRQHMVLELAKRERWYVKDILQKGGAGE